jgi:hypothetical protein
MEIITRQQAKEQGLSEYFTGKPCVNGHVMPRRVLDTHCRQCKRDRNNRPSEKVRASRAKRRHSYHLERTFGITVEMRNEMQYKQENCCATCGAEFKTTPHVDHDHTSGKVRGLLCGPCNRALGLIKDNPETLLRMVTYLKGSAIDVLASNEYRHIRGPNPRW